MIASKITLPLLLSHAVSYVSADLQFTHIRSVVESDGERKLEHEKSYNKLVADIEHVHGFLPDVGGSILLEFDEKKFDVSYHIHDLPSYCTTCFIAIMDADECKKDLDADDHHFDEDGRRRQLKHWENEDEGMDDPFSIDLTDIVTDTDGDAMGGIVGVENGFGQSSNRCKVAAVWAEVEEEVKYSKSPKSPKSAKHKRRLTGEEAVSRRMYHSHSTKTVEVMRVVGCGVLKLQGKHDDCDH